MDGYPHSLHQSTNVLSHKSRLRKMFQLDGSLEENHGCGKMEAEASLFRGSYFGLLPQRLNRQGVDTALDTLHLISSQSMIALERQQGLDAEVGGGAGGEALD